MTRPTSGTEAPPLPGVLLREPCPPADQVRFYAVDERGARVFEVCVSREHVTDELIARWKEDARAIAGQCLALVK